MPRLGRVSQPPRPGERRPTRKSAASGRQSPGGFPAEEPWGLRSGEAVRSTMLPSCSSTRTAMRTCRWVAGRRPKGPRGRGAGGAARVEAARVGATLPRAPVWRAARAPATASPAARAPATASRAAARAPATARRAVAPLLATACRAQAWVSQQHYAPAPASARSRCSVARGIRPVARGSGPLNFA